MAEPTTPSIGARPRRRVLGLFATFALVLSMVPGGLAVAEVAADVGEDPETGYRFIDSDEVGGPAYNRLLPNTAVGYTSNTQIFNVPIGFAFNFYGTLYDQITVVEDGVFLFGAGQDDPGFDVVPLNHAATDEDGVYALWSNWNITSGGADVYYQTFGAGADKVFVVEWRSVHTQATDSEDRVTFQVQLHQDGHIIEFHYTDAVTTDQAHTQGVSATIGIDNGTASELQYSHKTASVTSEFAIRFTSPSCDGKFPTIRGTSGDDVINGTPGSDVISGLRGDDIINGLGGNDTICGGKGDDSLNGDEGNDRLFGDTGDDLLKGGPGNDYLHGGRDKDVLRGQGGFDTLDGSRGRDTLVGGSGVDQLTGGTGKDALFGGPKGDTLKGGGGDDELSGGKGGDDLNGGKGTDDCRGGSGFDTAKKCENEKGIP
ncbi:MAG: calcium-binding protein [bacterium]|nr:calcium-binding protein [bacterium]